MDTAETRSIIIIGGGIGGAATLHNLRLRYPDRDRFKITLLEASDRLGGTVQTVKEEDFTFETGPNGFLNSKPSTLKLINELGIHHQLISADEAAKIRYICLEDELHKLPSDPGSFASFPLLSITQKARILLDFILPEGKNSLETVYEFGVRRFGKRFTELFLDPMVSGIFGGDARQLVLKQTFPNIYEMEQKFGSMFKAQMVLRKRGKKANTPKPHLYTLKGGMEDIFKRIQLNNTEDIRLNTEVLSVKKTKRFQIRTNSGHWEADELIAAAPAHRLSNIFSGLSQQLSSQLSNIPYAPIAVVGLGYDSYDLPQMPKGYGYLIPSVEMKKVLGVLFEDQIFPQRYPEYHRLFRVMIGGVRHPETIFLKDNELIEMARKELSYTLKIDKPAQRIFIKRWEKAIPQYDTHYCESRKIISDQAKRIGHLHFASNFWKGVSFNDCIENAYRISESIELNHDRQPLAA